MKTSKIEKVKNLIIVLIFFFCGVIAFVYFNISFNYPLNETRQKIIDFKERNGEYPSSLGDLDGIEKAKFMSVLKYKKNGDDFRLYFCRTKIGPCEVCTSSQEPYFDEI